ncbi:MAG: ABC transporter ATP-binding protein [Chloroflexi bacterium]|nr:ABC transporter ATP-binding protein [Chloroflexota bacterium]
MNAIIETEQLSKIYEPPQGWRRVTRPTPVTAVSGISLTVPQGELFGLLGPNGAGKTTLTKMLCTLIMPSSGRGQVVGHALQDTLAIRAAVGLVVSDERSFFWRLSARRNLSFFAAMHGLHGRAAANRVSEVLTDVDLLDVADRRFSNFSSGMRQRLAIARSLLHRPRLLFLDEPSRSLDPTATNRLHALLLRLMAGQGLTIFLITHDLAEAEKLCDRVALLHHGRIQAIGRPADLRRELRPQRLYTVQMGEGQGAGTAVPDQLRALVPGITMPEPGQVVFRAGEEDGVLTAVLDHLRQQAIPIQAITATPPSLEEVFAHYTTESAEREVRSVEQ